MVTKKMTRLPMISIWVMPKRFMKERAMVMTMIRITTIDSTSNLSLETG